MESSYSRYASILPPSNKNILHFKTNDVLLSYNRERDYEKSTIRTAVSTSLLSFNTAAISVFVCVLSASFTCSLVKLFSCTRERKEKEHVNCLLSEI